MLSLFGVDGSNAQKHQISSLFRKMLSIRAIIIILIIIIDKIIPDYDTSTEMMDESIGYSSNLDWIIRSSLRGFSHWDALYFTNISRSITYQYEHMHAFFPGLPLCIFFLHKLICECT